MDTGTIGQLIGLAVVFVNVVVSVAIGAWALRRKSTDERNMSSDQLIQTQLRDAQSELKKVRDEYREDINSLRDELRDVRDKSDARASENERLKATVGRHTETINRLGATNREQATQLGELTTALSDVRGQLADCLNHRRGGLGL